MNKFRIYRRNEEGRLCDTGYHVNAEDSTQAGDIFRNCHPEYTFSDLVALIEEIRR